MFVEIRRAPKFSEIYKKRTDTQDSNESTENESDPQTSYDIGKYLSFDTLEVEDTEPELENSPINISTYFADEPSEISNSSTIEFKLVPPTHELSDEDLDSLHENDSIDHLDALGMPNRDSDDLTDAEFSDNEKERIKEKG